MLTFIIATSVIVLIIICCCLCCPGPIEKSETVINSLRTEGEQRNERPMTELEGVFKNTFGSNGNFGEESGNVIFTSRTTEHIVRTGNNVRSERTTISYTPAKLMSIGTRYSVLYDSLVMMFVYFIIFILIILFLILLRCLHQVVKKLVPSAMTQTPYDSAPQTTITRPYIRRDSSENFLTVIQAGPLTPAQGGPTRCFPTPNAPELINAMAHRDNLYTRTSPRHSPVPSRTIGGFEMPNDTHRIHGAPASPRMNLNPCDDDNPPSYEQVVAGQLAASAAEQSPAYSTTQTQAHNSS